MIARGARRIAPWRELRAALVGAAAATGATLAAWLAFAAWVTVYLSLTAPGAVGELAADAARVVPLAVLVGAVTNVGTALGVTALRSRKRAPAALVFSGSALAIVTPTLVILATSTAWRLSSGTFSATGLAGGLPPEQMIEIGVMGTVVGAGRLAAWTLMPGPRARQPIMGIALLTVLPYLAIAVPFVLLVFDAFIFDCARRLDRVRERRVLWRKLSGRRFSAAGIE